MKKKIKIIDLLCLISVGEETPKRIKYCDNVYRKCDIGNDYFSDAFYQWFFKDICDLSILNDEVEILDEEETTLNTKNGNFTFDEDKDIPLIPDDELFTLDKYKLHKQEINYNFKVLQEKINQVVEEFNEYRKENE